MGKSRQGGCRGGGDESVLATLEVVFDEVTGKRFYSSEYILPNSRSCLNFGQVVEGREKTLNLDSTINSGY